MDAIKKFFFSSSSSSSSSSSPSPPPSSSSSSSLSDSFREHALGRIGIISEDCGSPFVGTLVCVLVGLMGWIPIAKKSSHRAVDQGKRTLLSSFLDKKVVGTHRPSPCIAPARGDAPVAVQSGCVLPTLIQDGKLIGCVNQQGKDKQLTFVMETNEKSQKVDLTRKHYINVVNIHKMIPHAVSDYVSEFVLSTFISKGGKPIEFQKHEGHEKRLSSLVVSRTITGLVRKQDKQVVGTQRTITGVVQAQGHIPVVRSGFEPSTLIQKDSKSVGFKKPQVILKFFSGSSSSLSDDSSFHHLQQHALSMLPVMLEDCFSPVDSTIIMKPIRNEDTDKIEEMTTTAAGCHGAANNFESTDVVEKESQISFLSKGYVYKMITLFESKRSNIVFEKESQKSFFSKGENYSIRTNPLFESEQPNLVFESNIKSGPIGESKNSTNIRLRSKQDKKVVGIHRMSPYLAPARGDASIIVQSRFLQPTLIRDGKLIGCENRQGKDKQLTSVMERTKKSHKVDLTRKQEINVVNIHRMIPKGGKPIESQKHKGQKKQLNSVMERRAINGLVRKQHKQVMGTQRTINRVVPCRCRRKSEYTGLVSNQNKQVVGTQRTITGVVPAQGHIPVVRSGFERPTLIQKDSRSIGSEKLQGSGKLQSSIAQSKKKPGIIDSSRKTHINVVSTRKGLVDERYLQSASKKETGNIDLSRKNEMKVVSTRKDLVDERLLQSVSKKKQVNIDPSRKNEIKVVGTLKDFVDGRSLQSVSKQKNVKVVPQVPPYKSRKISSNSELKPRWKF